MNEIKIEVGVPLLPRNNNRSFRRPSLWAHFNVGDSAFFAGVNGTRLSNTANSWGRTQAPRRKFASRSVNEDGVEGARVWRVQ